VSYLVPAYPGFPGQNPESHKTVVVVVVSSYGELFIESHLFYPTPPLHLAPHCGWPRWNFAETFDFQKLESLCYRVLLFLWSYV